MGPQPAVDATARDPAIDRQRLLAELFRLHAKRLERLFRRAGHGPDNAMDLVQDVFVRLAKCDLSLLQARPGCMVYRVARFVSIDALRGKAARTRAGLGPWDLLGDLDVADGLPSPEQRLLWREAITAGLLAIGRLPPKGGEAYRLSRLGDMSHRQIAAIQNVSPRTVENQIAACAARFRAIVAQERQDAA